MPQYALRPRTPVYLLTGHLGSGKTTLLSSWLKSPELQDCALIINEIGEVGLDQHILYGAADAASLVENACVCCTGLPGLADALADLFRARLERKIKPFRLVFIETTGLADPLPILKLFQTDSLLQERYQLAGIVTTLSATSGRAALEHRAEALSQVKTADLIILTKTDIANLVEQGALSDIASALNPGAALVTSSAASLNASTMLALLSSQVSGSIGQNPPFSTPPLNKDHQHAHNAKSLFVPLGALDYHLLQRLLERWISQSKPSLIRLKGVVELTGGSAVTVQWTSGDAVAEFSSFAIAEQSADAVRKGLTAIFEADFDAAGAFTINAFE